MTAPALDLMLPIHGVGPAEVLETARAAEAADLDGLWVPDHLLNASRPRAGVLECWSLLSAVVATTTRLPVGTLVLTTPFRDPVMLAKQAGTLAALAPGRLRLGLGAGGFTYGETCAQFGFPELPGAARVAHVRETIECLRTLWRDDPAEFSGRHVRATGVRIHPRPEQPLPIVLAARRPQMLALTATHADGWNCPLPHELAAGLLALERAGRARDTIDISVFAIAVIGASEREARAALERAGPSAQRFGDVEAHHVFGPPERAAERIAALARDGAARVVLDVRGMPHAEAIDLLVREVRPQL